MAYVIAGIVVVLIVAAGIAVFVRRATEGRGQAAIAAPDDNTPVGDTDQHSDVQPAHDRGEGGAGGAGGTGGEGEGSRPVTPESERLANRPR
jgi:hypothetical protein